MKREADRYFGENKAYAGLGRASVRGGVILVAGRGVNVLVQLASTILLARLLSPHEFGLVAMVTALVLFAPILVDLGTTDASTQKANITHVEISTLFWLNVTIGCTLTIALCGWQRTHRRFLRRTGIDRHCADIVAHVRHDGRIDPALRADAEGHGVPAHRDHRFIRERD